MKWRYLITIPLLTFASCETATNLVLGPEPTDPLDGYEGSLAQAGINTGMDWGPKQNLLLSEFKTLNEQHRQLKKDKDELIATNQNLQSQLNSEQSALSLEKGMRAQSEAETERLRKANHNHEAKILSLSIEKAKLEQEDLRRKIAALEKSITASGANTTEANATPPR
ncbi:MAG: hypothetical protein ACI89X_001101 [Planctomycetota bacterium]|jgi:hypothetical protein